MAAQGIDPETRAVAAGNPQRRPIAAVIGSGEADEIARRTAEQLGRCLVDAGFRVLTGGLGGIMGAASKGARSSPIHRDGDVIGIVPGYRAEDANVHVDIPICTGLGHGRNVLCAATGDVVLAVAGNSGTLSEIALAWTLGKPVACVGRSAGWALELAEIRPSHSAMHRIEGPFSPEDAAAWSLQQLGPRHRV